MLYLFVSKFIFSLLRADAFGENEAGSGARLKRWNVGLLVLELEGCV